MTEAFGIDFGTTNSVVARCSGAGSVTAVPLGESLPPEWTSLGLDLVLPSVIGFDGDTPTFGWPAKQRVDAKVEAVKRLFATADTVPVNGRSLAVEEVAAIYFRHLQNRAAAVRATDRLDRAVVTVPANSRGLARYRTKLAAGLAGIEVLALINEPTAAAMAHARVIGDDQRILVFDWGGGTLDVTILRALEGVFVEQASKGIQRLGGIDVDKAFEETVRRNVPGSASWREPELAVFRLNLELAKIRLSTERETVVPLPRGGEERVTRNHFSEAIWPLVKRVREPIDTCLRDSPGRIDHLVMVGGSSKIPMTRKVVTGIVGAEPSTAVDPMTAVAEGAALAAGIMRGIVTDLDFHVGTEHALGLVVADPEGHQGFSVLIERNTKYPARTTEAYTPLRDFQERVNLQVVEGDPAKPIGHEDNVVLKNWNLPLLDRRRREEASLLVTYEYDLDGIIHVRVRDQLTGRTMMEENLVFGAADRATLPRMRRTVDRLAEEEPAQARSRRADSAIARARDRVIPFVSATDRDRLTALVDALGNAAPADENALTEELERALREHAYLL